VLSGVNPGAWIVTAGGHLLREGQVVAPVDRENRPIAMGRHEAGSPDGPLIYSSISPRAGSRPG
jgi:hypothetical protein